MFVVSLIPVVLLFLVAQTQFLLLRHYGGTSTYSSNALHCSYNDFYKLLHFFLFWVFSSGVIVEFDPSGEVVDFDPSSFVQMQLLFFRPQDASTYFWKSVHCRVFCWSSASVELVERSVLFPPPPFLSLPVTQMQLLFWAHVSLSDWLCFLQLSSMDL